MNLAYVREVGVAKWMWRVFLRQVSMRILRRDNYLTLPTGESIRLPRTRAASEVFVTNADMDWGAEALFTRFLDPDGVFLDVGAHIGYYSLYVLPKVAHVYAFEPDRRNLPCLQWNLNRFPNTTIIAKAVTSVAGARKFLLRSESSLSHLSTLSDNELDPSPTVDVDATTLDEFTASLGRIVTGIKTDVEGSDFDVLRGAERLIRRDSPLILSELRYAPALADWCRVIGYGIYGFTRKPGNRSVAFAVIDSSRYHTKMLFLVPRRLQPEFDALAAT